MPNPTDAEHKIIRFCQAHPTMCQKKVADITGYHQSVISRTWHKYLPERIRHINKEEPTDLDKRIIAYYNEHPGIQQKDIAEALHCHRSSVSWTIGKYITGAVRRKQRNYSRTKEVVVTESVDPTQTRTCLGLGCTKKIPKDRYVHFCEKCQAKRVDMQYLPAHYVYIESNGRVR